MSWKFAGINFQGNFGGMPTELLKRLGVDSEGPVGVLTFLEAILRQNQGTSLGVVGGKTILLNRLLPYDCAYELGEEGLLDNILRTLSSTGDVLNYIVDGISGTYCFSVFSKGERVRRWATEPGNVWIDEGISVAGEKTAASAKPAANNSNMDLFVASDDEAHLLAVWEGFLDISFQELLHSNVPLFHVFE